MEGDVEKDAEVFFVASGVHALGEGGFQFADVLEVVRVVGGEHH